MSEFVKESRHFVKSQKSRRISRWFGKITNYRNHGSQSFSFNLFLGSVGSHPSTATFGFSGMKVHVNNAHKGSIGFRHFPNRSVLVVFWNVVQFLELYPVQFFGYLKNAFSNIVQTEIGFQFFLV